MSIEINCGYDKIVKIDEIVLNPENPNKHDEPQLNRIADLLNFYGWRHPVIVSNQSGMVVVGHGRILSAKSLGEVSVPVNYQDFPSYDVEYAWMVADNGIAGWASLDYALVNAKLPDLGPFDLNLLGIKSFFLEPSERSENNPSNEWQGMPEFNQTDKTAYRRLIVNFKDKDSVLLFCEKVHPLTDSTRYIWYPEIEIEHASDKRYESKDPA
jgi:hypothetical protein